MAVSKKARRPVGRPPTTPAPTSAADARIARLRELVAVLESSTLNELSYEDSDVAVTLVRAPRGGHTTVTAAHAPMPVVSVSTPVAAAPAAPNLASDPDLITIKSPFVGTFYRAPKPGMPNFTDVGERVHRGKTLCIIEAMKLMNEIESEVDGTIAEIVAENGHAVQYGDTLFRIRKA